MVAVSEHRRVGSHWAREQPSVCSRKFCTLWPQPLDLDTGHGWNWPAVTTGDHSGDHGDNVWSGVHLVSRATSSVTTAATLLPSSTPALLIKLAPSFEWLFIIYQSGNTCLKTYFCLVANNKWKGNLLHKAVIRQCQTLFYLCLLVILPQDRQEND